MLATSEDATERARAVSAAKVQTGRALKQVGEESIQLHGGIGMTMETSIGHYFKRATILEMTVGSADWHLDRLARLDGLVGEYG
jgi:alkylation response protein AidB-like acyl-CoA dehydrogenase